MPNESTAQNQLKVIAMDWCIRLHGDECSRAEREEFQRWHDADSRHAEEYARACRIWRLSSELSPTPNIARQRPPVRNTSRVLARAATIFIGLGISWAAGWYGGYLPGSVRFYLAQQDARQIVLPDSTQVDLNRRSTLWYLGYRHQRSVHLSDGEAFFDVFHDAASPFVIRADSTDIQVTGTQFNVWTAPQRTAVTVSQGTVLVWRHGDRAASLQAAELTVGMQAVLMQGKPLQLNRVNAQQEAAWRTGKLVLDNVALRDALPLINRYLDEPVAIADDAVAELRIGGSYKTSELEVLVHQLPQIFPVELRRTADKRILTGRPARS